MRLKHALPERWRVIVGDNQCRKSSLTHLFRLLHHTFYLFPKGRLLKISTENSRRYFPLRHQWQMEQKLNGCLSVNLRKHKFGGNHFCAKGSCVDSVGVNAQMMRKCVKYQEKHELKDKQLSLYQV